MNNQRKLKAVTAVGLILMVFTLAACSNGSTDEPEVQKALVGATNVVVKKGAGVTNDQFNIAFATIQSAYNSMATAGKNNFASKIDVIVVTTGSAITQTGKTMYVGISAKRDDIGDFMMDDIVHINQNDAIRLAMKTDKSKVSV